MIEIRELTKRYGPTLAVDHLSFRVEPGCVTGFLGPNGAGKSTTMRAVLGLDIPTSGDAVINGRHYADIDRPLHHVGALLDAGAVHGGRGAFDHLYCLARSNGIRKARVHTVLDRVGLTGVAGKRIGGFSLGMKQRLGIAAALLGDPGIFLFDEPINGLDPEGIRWIRDLMRSLAAEGRTVLVSSHLMSEMELTADHIVVVGRGRLIAETSIAELAERFKRDVLVRTPDDAELARLLRSAGATVTRQSDGSLAAQGLDAVVIGDIAVRSRIAVHELTPRSDSLEDAYLKLTNDSLEYRAERTAP
ncbi:ATP-binding cassette domain-containing protein [Amycolatopsis sp. lyj-84]|uniref:ATP-binding cassette domain-containing protein n=1 Tax=Amycolatopsis sp. lyj-84 TaxID=2789284 RepID=UPI00397AA128